MTMGTLMFGNAVSGAIVYGPGPEILKLMVLVDPALELASAIT